MINPADPLPDGPWLDHIDPEFVAATLPGPHTTRAETVAGFRRHGVAAMVALAAPLVFDADYFRETNPAWEDADDDACYRAWLLEGIGQGVLPSGDAHLRSLDLALSRYPTAFHWQYYARLRPQCGGDRWQALQDFCEQGFAELGESFPYGPDAADLLTALGQRFSASDDALAVRAYELAQQHAPLPATSQQHLADAYLRLELWRPAMQLYAGLLGNYGATGWTARNFVKCATKLLAWDELSAGLARAKDGLAGDPLWDGTLDEAADAIFTHHLRQARVLMSEQHHEAADALVATTIEALATLLESLQAHDQPGEATARQLLILANDDEPEQMARGAGEKRRLLDGLGIAHACHPIGEAGAWCARLPEVSALILFRAAAFPPVIRLILEARLRGIPTVFDGDEALSDPDIVPPIDAFRDRITPALYDDVRTAIALRRATARLCDFAMAPTEPLAGSLRSLSRRRHAFLVPGSLLPDAEGPDAQTPSRLVVFLRVAVLTFLDADPGTPGGALIAMLNTRPDVELRIAGPVHLASAFHLRPAGITHAGIGPAPFDYWQTLRTADINLILACDTADDANRAEASWAEAAAFAVPSLLLARADRLAHLRDERQALRATDPATWQAALERLLLDAGLRQRIGKRAQRDITARRAKPPAADALARALRVLHDPAFASAPTPGRAKELAPVGMP